MENVFDFELGVTDENFDDDSDDIVLDDVSSNLRVKR